MINRCVRCVLELSLPPVPAGLGVPESVHVVAKSYGMKLWRVTKYGTGIGSCVPTVRCVL